MRERRLHQSFWRYCGERAENMSLANISSYSKEDEKRPNKQTQKETHIREKRVRGTERELTGTQKSFSITREQTEHLKDPG